MCSFDVLALVTSDMLYASVRSGMALHYCLVSSALNMLLGLYFASKSSGTSVIQHSALKLSALSETTFTPITTSLLPSCYEIDDTEPSRAHLKNEERFLPEGC